MTKKPNNDPSVFAEPQYQDEILTPDPSERVACNKMNCEKWELEHSPSRQVHELVEHGIGDEPALRASILPLEPGQVMTWKELYVTRWAQVSPYQSLGVLLLIIILAGPAAVAGAFLSGTLSNHGVALTQLLYVILFGPLTEELLKTMILITVLETRPWFIRSRMSIIIAALSGALLFAVIENLVYLKIYIKDPSEGIIYWRWTVCTAVHVLCTLVASLGLCKMWEYTRAKYEKANLSLAFPWLMTAFVMHGAYNTFAVILNLTGFEF